MGVFVVPDNQMQNRHYGEEVPRLSPQENLANLVKTLETHRAENPVYSPFPAGTPTMGRQQLTQQQGQFEQGMALDQAQLEEGKRQFDATLSLQRAKAARSGGGGGGSSGRSLTPWQQYNIAKDAQEAEQGQQETNALTDAYESVGELVTGGQYTKEDIEQEVWKQAPELTKQGVDPQKVIDYLWKLPEPVQQEEESGNWYTNLDKQLGGWLPFGASRR